MIAIGMLEFKVVKKARSTSGLFLEALRKH